MRFVQSPISGRPAAARRRPTGVFALVAMAVLTLASLMAAPGAGAFSSSAPQPGPPSVNAGGYMTCGLQADNIAACWGANVGQGDAPTEGPGQSTPPAGVTFTEVNAGYSHGCGVVTDGTVACWGSNHNGASTPPAGTFTHVAPGFVFTCALEPDSTATCWGTNDAGQVSNTPATETFSKLTVGIRHACGLRSTDSTVVCWGSNAYGQVSNVPSGTFKDVNSGNFDVCALRQSADPAVDGTAVCWGRNAGGQQAGTPAGAFTQVTAGFQHACGLRADGTIECWGRNIEGQATAPAGTFNNVSAGTFHSCGMQTDNTAVCWGNNAQGRVRPEVTSMAPLPAVELVPYSHQFTSTYMSPAGTWTLTAGTLPPGLTLSPSGLLSGTPTDEGTYSGITVSVANDLSPSGSQTFEIIVVGVADGDINCIPNSGGKCLINTVEETVDPVLP